MAVFSRRELMRLICPHYILNIALALSFIFLKTISPFCDYLFVDCDLGMRESEILFFTIVVIIFRTRKQGSVHLLPYVGTACMLAKLGNGVLFFYSDPLYGIVYSVICLLQLLFLPEPSYQGPDNILYFNAKDLDTQLQQDKKVVWVIELYAAWSPACIDFASHFSELSAKYGIDNLRFGKVDLARNPECATQYKINTSALSKQLPTMILFKGGKEYIRRPLVNEKSKLVPYTFTYENVVSTFDLNNIYKECRENPLKSTKKQLQTEARAAAKQHAKEE